jgi:hypothetical protein
MTPYRALIPAVAMLAAAACTEPTRTITGEWLEIPSASASHTPRRLELRGSGGFSFLSGPSAVGTRTEGVYKVSGTSVAFFPERLVMGDGTSEPYSWGGLFDDATFAFDGGDLVLTYTVYPADAPMVTTMRFSRLR